MYSSKFGGKRGKEIKGDKDKECTLCCTFCILPTSSGPTHSDKNGIWHICVNTLIFVTFFEPYKHGSKEKEMFYNYHGIIFSSPTRMKNIIQTAEWVYLHWPENKRTAIMLLLTRNSSRMLSRISSLILSKNRIPCRFTKYIIPKTETDKFKYSSK